MKSTTAAIILAFTSASIASPTNFKRADCEASYNACRIGPDANMSYCSSQYSQCLAGSSSKSATATSTFSSIAGIPGGCNPAHPGSCPSSTASSASASSSASSNLPLGANCDPSIKNQCANGANCYATNNMLIPQCGNFQASCSSDSQCAYNTCNDGLCNGFIPSSSSAVTTATKTAVTSVITNTATTITKPVTETHVAGTVTEVKTFITTYCPQSTVTVFNTAAETAAPTAIPGGCNPAHPGSCPTATSVTASPANTGAATNLPGWTVENLIRYCNEAGTGCDYNFGIDNGNGFKQNCTISTSDSKIDETFYNKNCTDGSVYRVSWGYSDQFGADHAFAVLTIDDIQSKNRAFFGVADVNSQPVSASSPKGSGHFGNIGPEKVYPIN